MVLKNNTFGGRATFRIMSQNTESPMASDICQVLRLSWRLSQNWRRLYYERVITDNGNWAGDGAGDGSCAGVEYRNSDWAEDWVSGSDCNGDDDGF